jgi:hypothetical protein
MGLKSNDVGGGDSMGEGVCVPCEEVVERGLSEDAEVLNAPGAWYERPRRARFAVM